MGKEEFGSSLSDLPVEAHIVKIIWTVSNGKHRSWNFNSLAAALVDSTQTLGFGSIFLVFNCNNKATNIVSIRLPSVDFCFNDGNLFSYFIIERPQWCKPKLVCILRECSKSIALYAPIETQVCLYMYFTVHFIPAIIRSILYVFILCLK